MMPSPAAGEEEPRWDSVRRIARPGTAGLPPVRRALADPAEAGYLEDVGRPGDDLAPGTAAPVRARRDPAGVPSSPRRRDDRPPGAGGLRTG